MRDLPLIGLYSTRSQSGKTSFAAHLQQVYNFQVGSFATPIKRTVSTLLREAGLGEVAALETLGATNKEKALVKLPNAPTPRDLMRLVGAMGRAIDPLFWVKLLLKKLPGDVPVVIDDVRFEEEFAAIKQVGGVVWKIERPDAPEVSTHESEGRLEKFTFDRVLMNDGALPDLYRQFLIEARKSS